VSERLPEDDQSVAEVADFEAYARSKSVLNQGAIASGIIVICWGVNYWQLGWKVAAVSAVLTLIWFAIVVGLLVRQIAIPDFKGRNEEGLPHITGNRVILGTLPWASRLALAALVACGLTLIVSMVLHGQAGQQTSIEQAK